MTELIGSPEDLPMADLPTRRCILRKMLLEKMVESREGDRYYSHVTNMEVAEKVAKSTLSLWKKINAKIVGALVAEREIVRKVFMLWTRMENVANGGKKKSSGKRKKKGEASKERESFLADLDKWFDICACHCPILSCSESSCPPECVARVHIHCSCPRESKIPELELEFIYDQRSKTGVKGKMMMLGVDAVETARQEKALQRELMEKKAREEKEARAVAKEEELFARHRQEREEEEKLLQDWDENDNVPEPSPVTSSYSFSHQQNREHFPRTVMAAMRGGVSQTTLANILSSFAVDMGIATRDNPSLLVDKSKVAREMEREMERLMARAEEWMRSSGIDAIQFDGKDEKAKAWVTLECGTRVIRHVKEDHITLTDCQGEFLMHFTREKVEGVRAGKVVALRIATFLETFGIDATLKLIGADSTNLNTGSKEGAIALLEQKLEKRLVWSICMLHTNELPLRHLIQKLDGPTGSGNTLTGPAGRLLPQTQSLPYNPNFEPLSCGEPLVTLPPEVLADLSWDQQYGYKMIKALEAGSVPRALQIMVIGPLDHSRWLTCGNRLVLLSVSFDSQIYKKPI